MKKLFIVRLFTIIMLTGTGLSPAFSNSNNRSTKILQTGAQAPVKPLPVQAKPAPAKPALVYKPYYHRPTAEDSALMKDKSLNGQYKYALTKVYRYQEPFVTSLYKNLRDTINADRRKLQEAQTKLAALNKATSNLQSNVTEKEKSLAQSNERVNSVSFLGMDIDKSVYNLIMWGLVLAFGITAGVVIARSGSYSREAKYRTGLYTELEEEFKTYKAKANDKEKKLARELQTERNKVDELMGRS